MKNIFTKLIILVLTLAISLTFIACDKDGDGNTRVTGKYEYKVMTGTNDDGSTYKYYAITGYQVSSEDAEKISNNDYSNIERKIEIPKTAEELGAPEKDWPVEEIAAGAFSGLKIPTQVIVGENIKKIGSGAFANCTNLQEIELPFTGKSADAVNQEKHFGFIFGSASTEDGNVEITAKPNAFKNADGEELATADDITFTLPVSLTKVTVKATEIKNSAFYGVTTVKEVLIPNVTDIQSHAFYGCTLLRKIDLTKVVNVYQFAFSGCTSLYKITWGNDLKLIDHNAFNNCAKLNDVASDGSYEVFTLPSSLESLGKNAFASCAKLNEVVIPASITVIPESCFASCSYMTKIQVLADSVTFKASSLSGCTRLNENVLDKNGNKIAVGNDVLGISKK
ncbi:MAG: leucine-rich repeat protein [Clostridia bacterium]|nr:leucine-rich repeat protein [Clostridia bacterium]